MKWTVIRGAAVLAAMAVAGCETPLELPSGAEREAPDGRTFDGVLDFTTGVNVLNTQLRGIIDPDIIDPEIEPQAWGHVQLKLTAAGEDGFLAEWKGKLYNPNLETFSIAAIIDPDIVPGPLPGDGELPEGTALILSLFRGTPGACGIVEFDSDGGDPEFIPYETGTDMIINPDIYEVVLVSESSVVAGRFGVPDPTEILGFNPQPDPPGRVRCSS